MKKLILIAFILCGSFIFSACKTAEDIRREKDLSSQMEEQNRSFSESSEKLNLIQAEVAKISGEMEELKHSQSTGAQGLEERVASLEGRLDKMQEKQDEYDKLLQELSEKIGKKNSQAPTAVVTTSEESEMKAGLSLLAKKQYTQAKEKLLPLLDGKLSQGKKNQIQYSLGVIEYENKDYERSLLYLGKLYAKYPSASVAPGALLYIGKGLMATGKKLEAKESFQELINNHEKSKEAAQAAKLLKSLK